MHRCRRGNAEICDAHNALLRQHNEIADAERADKGGGWMKGPQPFVPRDAMPWLTNPNREQRRQGAREYYARTMNDPNADYWHGDRGTLYKSANLAMQAAKEMGDTGECNSVRIDPVDGSIIGSTEE